MLKLIKFLFLTVLLLPMLALAGDGTIGATSTGTSVISLTLNSLIQIRNITDPWTLTPWTGSGDLVENQQLCVSSNNYKGGAGRYSITATGLHTLGGTLNLNDGTNNLPYIAAWDYLGTGVTYADLTPGAALTDQHTQGNLGYCNTASNYNTRVRVTITEANLLAADAGTYTDTLTLVVAPTN